MPKLYYLDCDLNGLDSIQDVLESRPDDVVVYHIDTFEKFDQAVVDLQKVIVKDDLVVVDTITSLADTTRGDSKLGTDSSGLLWEKRAKYMGDKDYLTVYTMAGQLIMRRISNLRACGARIIVVAHEAEQVDETDYSKKHGPAVNAGLLGMLIPKASDVFRVSIQNGDVLNEDGTKIVIPHEARTLQMRRDEEVIAKYHVSLEMSPKIKKIMPNPTMPKIEKHLGKKPSFLVLYGAPGVGKSTLAVSGFRLTPTTTKNESESK